MLVIEKPPVDNGDLPPLPPFLQKRGGGGGRTFIIPCLSIPIQDPQIDDVENDWVTVIYQWMYRIRGSSVFDGEAVWEKANINTREYRQWLETYETPTGVPPHIGFGGHVGLENPTLTPFKFDAGLLLRWSEYVKKTFV